MGGGYFEDKRPIEDNQKRIDYFNDETQVEIDKYGKTMNKAFGHLPHPIKENFNHTNKIMKFNEDIFSDFRSSDAYFDSVAS